MTSDLTYLRDDIGEDTLGPPRRRPREAAAQAIARIALEQALPPALRKRIARDETHVLVVEVPSADWVEPVREACERLRHWTTVFARTGASRSEDVPHRGNDKLARTLAHGGAVLGVSQDGTAYLPSALATADTRVRLGTPDNALVDRVIRAVTGRAAPVLPAGAAAGLTYWELAACIRGKPRSCRDRLASAARAKTIVDPAVAEAPAFETLAGYGAAHRWGTRLLHDLEAFRRDPSACPFHAIDRNAVLSSTPGLGKSTFVRALAKTARLPLIVSSVSAWFTSSNGYLDGVLKAIDKVFDQAIYSSPSILFLDEIDSIPNRNFLDARNSSWWTPVCTHILLKIDRVATDPDAKVCLIGATNHAARLDPALVRPGRLTRVITVEPPSAADIAVIARQHLGDDLAGLDLIALGEMGLGATGAEVAGWVTEARATARAAGRPMTPDDLMGVVAPPDTRPEHVVRRSAVHELAHAVAATLTGTGHVRQVDVVMRGDNGGGTSLRLTLPPMPLREDLERFVLSLLCGRAAEVVLLGEACAGSGGANDSDLARATAIVAGMHASFGLGPALAYLGPSDGAGELVRNDPALRAAVESDLRRLHAEAERLVTRNRDLIEIAADRLVRERVMSGDALRALIAAVEREAVH